MLGIMLPTWFLSMWMSNTATTAMMIPILNAILAQIKEVRNKGKPHSHIVLMSIEKKGNSSLIDNPYQPALVIKIVFNLDVTTHLTNQSTC